MFSLFAALKNAALPGCFRPRFSLALPRGKDYFRARIHNFKLLLYFLSQYGQDRQMAPPR